jgi:hypothetical protein
MKTFRLDNGDLSLGQDGYALVEGSDKLRLDLSVAMREPFGCDRFHPRWGSLLYDYTGKVVDDETGAYIKGEITRLVQNYVYVQGELLSKDVAAGRRPRFSRGEVVSDMSGIDLQGLFDSYKVRVRLRTLSGEEVTLLQTVRTT